MEFGWIGWHGDAGHYAPRNALWVEFYARLPVTRLIGTLPASYAHFLPVYDYQRSSCRRWRSKWQTACSRIISGSYRGPQRTANDSA